MNTPTRLSTGSTTRVAVITVGSDGIGCASAQRLVPQPTLFSQYLAVEVSGQDIRAERIDPNHQRPLPESTLPHRTSR